MAEQKGGRSPDPNSMFVLAVPDRGPAHFRKFKDQRKGLAHLREWLEKKSFGEFNGEVYAFYGQQVNYSQPQMEFHFFLESVGHVKHADPNRQVMMTSPEPDDDDELQVSVVESEAPAQLPPAEPEPSSSVPEEELNKDPE